MDLHFQVTPESPRKTQVAHKTTNTRKREKLSCIADTLELTLEQCEKKTIKNIENSNKKEDKFRYLESRTDDWKYLDFAEDARQQATVRIPISLYDGCCPPENARKYSVRLTSEFG
ncbi:hypothetical protein WA026_002488 [Henosepilachna vigintioctopunctata]|uniref:Uncharacterized protein n=1 Tax=Henosepilachna vigintioctopunctata TaxID=420089 RepID=A0AAW1U0I9_9CUCU